MNKILILAFKTVFKCLFKTVLKDSFKKLLKVPFIFGLFISLWASVSFAQFPPFELCFSPYVGADAGYRHTSYSGGSDLLFETKYPQAAVYGGIRFSDYTGIEGGYKFTNLKSQFVRVNAGDTVLGLPPLFPPEHYIAKAQFKGWYGSFMGYIPACFIPVDLIGSIGFVRLQTYHYESPLIDQELGPDSALSFLAQGRTFKDKRTLLTLGLGLQYIYCDAVGIRFKVDWENTDRIKNLKPIEVPSPLVLSLKNSVNYNLGVFIPF